MGASAQKSRKPPREADREGDVSTVRVLTYGQQLQGEWRKHQLPSPVSLEERQNGYVGPTSSRMRHEGWNRGRKVMLTPRIVAGVPFPISCDLLSDLKDDDSPA